MAGLPSHSWKLTDKIGGRIMRKAFFGPLLVTATLAACVLVACGGGGGTVAPSNPNPVPTVPQSASTSIPLSDVGAPFALPNVGGFAETITLPSNNAPAGTNASVIASTTLPGGAPPLPDGENANAVYSVSITLPVTVTFTGLPAFSVTVSQSVFGSGFFAVAFYDPTVGVWNNVVGSTTDSGYTILFSGTNAATTLVAGDTYTLSVYNSCPSCY
jgi:hypothetical protein